MRKLTITQFMTLDGVVQSPGAPEEYPSGGWLRVSFRVPTATTDEI